MAAWGSPGSEPRWWRRLCPPVPTWHHWGDLQRGREGLRGCPTHQAILTSLSLCLPILLQGLGMQEPPHQIHCPAQDKAQPFSKESSGWESHQVCSHLMFLCEHLIQPEHYRENPENSRIPEDCHSMPEAPKGHSQCSVPGSDCECTHQPNTQHREAVRPYLGKLSRFSAAALAACGSLRRVPSQPTPPGTRRSNSGSVTPVLAPLTMPSSSQGHHPLLGCQGGGRNTNGHYLDWDAFGNVHDQLHVGVVVVVRPSRDRHVVICHLDVLCKTAQGVLGARSLSASLPKSSIPGRLEQGKIIYSWIWVCRRKVCDSRLGTCRAGKGCPSSPPGREVPFWDVFRNYLR